ncbi:hypothetical protein LTS18_004853, partial [Coniosporium uncinatum]
MPSHLRNYNSFEPISAETTRTPYPSSAPPQKKQKMSLTQTYFIASSARSKLGKEAMKPDHNLRLLVGHANLLDSLMVELHDAEREQEAWFNQSVKSASKADKPQHVQWIDTIEEEDADVEEDNASATDSDSEDEDFSEEDFEMAIPLRRLRSPPVTVTSTEIEDFDEEAIYDDMEKDVNLALTRTPSHHSPPELINDSDSEDDSPPQSPPTMTVEYNEKQREAIATTTQAYFDDKSFVQEGFYIPEREAPLI